MESYFFIICNDSEQISSSFGTVIDGSNFDIFSYQMTGKDVGIEEEERLILSGYLLQLDFICCYERWVTVHAELASTWALQWYPIHARGALSSPIIVTRKGNIRFISSSLSI